MFLSSYPSVQQPHFVWADRMVCPLKRNVWPPTGVQCYRSCIVAHATGQKLFQWLILTTLTQASWEGVQLFRYLWLIAIH